jgi:hypothetical protein
VALEKMADLFRVQQLLWQLVKVNLSRSVALETYNFQHSSNQPDEFLQVESLPRYLLERYISLSVVKPPAAPLLNTKLQFFIKMARQ